MIAFVLSDQFVILSFCTPLLVLIYEECNSTLRYKENIKVKTALRNLGAYANIKGFAKMVTYFVK